MPQAFADFESANEWLERRETALALVPVLFDLQMELAELQQDLIVASGHGVTPLASALAVLNHREELADLLDRSISKAARLMPIAVA